MTLIVAASAMLAFAAGDLAAQGAGSVTGSVTSAGVAVAGVQIQFPALRLGELTDDQGRFRFEVVPAGRHEIRAEVVGCRPASWTVDVPEGARVAVDLKLDERAIAPSPPGLVRAGLAAQTPEVELPFTVERLELEEVERNPGRTIADLLRAKFPGVKVVQGSGLPGEGRSIQFRGPNSISGSEEPLVVVDGVITGGGLDDLDPLDVESLEVLKGSAAAAIYGSRGQAGVIEITTRRGVRSASARCFIRSDPST
ncbi:MAG: TonB-dependent receptor plug domain-containing protein [Gemmatimonadetes bacterium]|nr:TonB-dependent receptor plug domain-containing protein [Gemmatimonadota bacterium]